MAQRAPFDRFVRWVSGRRSLALFGLLLIWFVAWTAAVYLLLDALVADEHQRGLSDIAAPLMTAFGALFAFLTAFVISIEWNQHRDVEQIVGNEAGACLRLIWASQSPDCDGRAIRTDLLCYLHSVREEEWPTLAEGAEGCDATHERMTQLQLLIRRTAADKTVRGPVATDLIKSADAMAVTRAERLNAAGHDLPTPLFLLALLSGIMLTLNAVALSLHFERGYSVVIGGLVVLIAMDLALLIALSTPFTGALRVHGRPLARVLTHLSDGRYGAIDEQPVTATSP